MQFARAEHQALYDRLVNGETLGQAMLPDEVTLGQLADVVLYFGRSPTEGALVRMPAR